MNRVLRNVAVAEPRLIGEARPVDETPPQTGVFTLYGSAVTDARAAGLAEGRATERADLSRRISDLTTSVAAAVTTATEDRRRLRDEQASMLAATAFDIAELVLGCPPPAEVTDVVVGRLIEALHDIDDGPLTLSVSEGDAEIVTAALDGAVPVDVAVDHRLGRGEARVRGPWSSIDMTRSVALETVREALS